MIKTIKKAVFFDMDGTLLQTAPFALPAMRDTFMHLKEAGEFHGDIPEDEQVLNVFGMTVEEIWNRLLPGTSAETKEKANRMMLEFEIERLKKGEGKLYDGVLETLHIIKEQGLHLFVVSNGEKLYIETVVEETGLVSLFTDLYSAGRFQTTSKNDLVALLLKEYNIEHAIMVGDRSSDIQAGRANGLYTIACDFGFANPGELDGADASVKKFRDIVPLIEKKMKSLP